MGMKDGVSVHAYPSPLLHETRMFKQAQTLLELDDLAEIILLGLGDGRLPLKEHVSHNISIIRVNTFIKKSAKSNWKNALVALEWSIRVLLVLKRQPIDVFSAHNLASLPLAVMIKSLKSCNIIYETHEFETKRTGWSKTLSFFAGLVERFFIRFVSSIVVTNGAMANVYANEYGNVPIITINNYPSVKMTRKSVKKEIRDIKKQYGIGKDDTLYLYQGVYGEGRGLLKILDYFKDCENGKLLIMGFSDESKTAKIIEKHIGSNKNTILVNAVPQAELLSWTSAADVGLHFQEDLSLSAGLSMGNKFYEYLLAGIPIISTHHPDAKEVIDQHQVGWIIEDVTDFHNLARTISMKEIDTKKRNAKKAWEKYTWEGQERKYRAIYERALKNSTKVH